MPAHFLFAAMLNWGHIRPSLALALNLLITYPDLYITFATHIASEENISKEIQRFGASDSVMARFKLSTVGTIIPGPPAAVMFPSMVQLMEVIGPHVADLIKSWITSPGQNFDALPTFILADMFLSPIGPAAKAACSAASISDITMFMFMPTNVSSHLEYNSPGGHVDTYLKKAAQWRLNDPAMYGEVDHMNLTSKGFLHSEGRLVKRFGLESIYDYEFSPQIEAWPLPPPVAIMHETTLNFYREQCQGIVLPVASDLEPGVAEKVEELYGPNHSCLPVGPQFSPKVWAGDVPTAPLSSNEQECLDFLDASEVKYGKKSVLYISFGSLFFPTHRPDLVYTLLESLVAAEPPVPFLFAIAGAPPDIAAGLTEYVATSAVGIGKVSSWTPQMRVLQHEATGWFLSHGGSNSTYESLLTSVPLIFWPFGADQPAIASQFTRNLKISYELMQIRNGPGVGKITYRGVTPLGTKEALTEELNALWKTIRGPDGEATRKRFQDAGALVRQSYQGGASKQAMKRFEMFM